MLTVEKLGTNAGAQLVVFLLKSKSTTCMVLGTMVTPRQRSRDAAYPTSTPTPGNIGPTNGFVMDSDLLISLLLVVYGVPSWARLTAGRTFSVFVPETASLGTEIVAASALLATRKAELPCAKTEGDPYGRFRLTEECALVVANPLDWSVQSEYTVKIRVGGLVDEVVTVLIQVTDVSGYPPMYNETCETPVNPTDVHLKGCPVGKYGLLCDQTCICKNGARCHGFNGACKCQHGWQGVACDIYKPDISVTTTPGDSQEIYISANVTIRCRVYHMGVETLSLRFPNASELVSVGVTQLDVNVFNAQLHHEGLYTCQAKGKDGKVYDATIVLNVNCPPNRKGELCEEVCDCLHGASCDRWAGCVCPPGWTGTRCQTKCPHGTYGKDCTRDCSCQNGAICSPSDGRCNCTSGWYGADCDGPCPKSRYGWRCRQVCSCQNNGTCHNVDGMCACVPPWEGRNCEKVQLRVTQAHTSLIEILVPLGSVLLIFIVVLLVLYKTGCFVKKEDHEAEVLRELRRVEEDLAQSLQPGWLKRWQKKIRHLTPGPLIGIGKFGQVIQARLRTPKGDVVVAAKTVRAGEAQSYRDFYREAAILVAVHEEKDHDVRRSHIVQLLGIITKSKQKYILLEYSPKGDLLWVLQQFRNNEDEALGVQLGHFLRYAVHVARALGELQRLRIVHRDVAARNVLITADDVAKLADFGLARDVYTAADYVSTSHDGCHKLLPLKWMALESIETGEYTCQSDVWSFGVLLWEIATLGQDPCYGDKIHPSFPELAVILRRGIRLPRPAGCSGDLYGLMRACWRENPTARPEPDALEKSLEELMKPYEILERETAL
ncbi:Endothelial cell-specific molecule 1 [Branchiostoma belcheri]|nr:Endothelial cell-specific molecule 1 [Branchiostoma belcheri]